MKISKKRYIQSFLLAVVFLAIIRAFILSPSKGGAADVVAPADSIALGDTIGEKMLAEVEEEHEASSVEENDAPDDNLRPNASSDTKSQKASDDGFIPHKIYSVPSYARTFPDSNDVQLVAADRWGVTPVENREEAERRKMELVYVGSNPYFFVDKLRSSIPYLVPRASTLLQDLGRNFYDSLQVKGLPLHKIIVTSVLRTKEDVARLQRRNSNATPNSCHLRGTTFDVSYHRYIPVAPPGEERRLVRNDSLKWVLSEALRDLREQGRCYVKYERKQGCYHITVR